MSAAATGLRKAKSDDSYQDYSDHFAAEIHRKLNCIPGAVEIHCSGVKERTRGRWNRW
jgi:hypothetical protein